MNPQPSLASLRKQDGISPGSSWPRYLSDIACLLFVTFLILTISEPLYFQREFYLRNYILFSLSIIGLFQLTCHRPLSRTARFAISFFIIGLISIAIQSVVILDKYDLNGSSSQYFILSIILYAGLCFFSGCALPLIVRSRIAKPISLIAAIVTLYLFLSNSEGMRIWWNGIVYVDGSRPNHLSVDDTVSLLFFLAYASSRSWLRYGFAIALLACLFVSGSRASFFISILAFASAEIMIRRDLTQKIYALIGAILIILITYLTNDSAYFIFESLFPNKISGDSSFQERSIFMNEGSYDLIYQFMIGDPTLFVYRFGYTGAYIHNIISAWQFYGFVPFIMVVSAIISAFYNFWSIRCFGERRDWTFGFIILVYAALGALTAKFIGTYALWFALGYWSAIPLLVSVPRFGSGNLLAGTDAER